MPHDTTPPPARRRAGDGEVFHALNTSEPPRGPVLDRMHLWAKVARPGQRGLDPLRVHTDRWDVTGLLRGR